MQALLGQTTPTIGEPDDGTNFGTNNEDKKKDREKDEKFFNNLPFPLHKRRTKLTVNRYDCHKFFKKNKISYACFGKSMYFLLYCFNQV